MKPSSFLPTKRVAHLLDTQGIEQAWKTLLYTLASKSFDITKFKMIQSSGEFTNITPLEDNPLEGLSIGEISVLYEFSLAHVNHVSRKESGQYFTPDDVAELMASLTDEFPNGRWLDPCSGVGNLSYWLAVRNPDPEEFITNHLVLTDRDPLALLIARTLFTLLFQNNNPNLFEELKPNFIVKDFLADFSVPEYDYALLNPPYAQTIADTKFATAKTRDLYAYFLEKIIKTSKGFVAVTPQSFTNGTKFNTLRDLLTSTFSSLDIYCFDNIPDSIFKGIKFGSQNTNTANSTRAAITVAHNNNNNNNKGHRITPLLRWKAEQRTIMFSTIRNHLTSIEPSPLNLFPKNWKTLTGLYNFLLKKNFNPLHTILNKTPTDHQLVVPTTPRYFISATKRHLNRTSYKTLYFNSEEELNQVYLLLNSSFLYWWWKLNDGGMTLSSETLLSTPLVTVTSSDSLVKALEASEQINLVGKLNAGKINENVKHPLELVEKINTHIFGSQTSAELIKIHNNSDVED